MSFLFITNLISLSNILLFSVFKSSTSLVKIISSILLFFILLKVLLFSQFSFQILLFFLFYFIYLFIFICSEFCSNTTDLSINLVLNLFISINSFVVDFFFIHGIISTENIVLLLSKLYALHFFLIKLFYLELLVLCQIAFVKIGTLFLLLILEAKLSVLHH